MYHYIEDKEFLKRMRGLCSNIINQLVQRINNDAVMKVEAHLVGSGAKNLETQNANNPIDLDYNLCVISTIEICVMKRWDNGIVTIKVTIMVFQADIIWSQGKP